MSSKVTFTLDQVLALLSDGNSIRGAARILGNETQESTIRGMINREVSRRNVESVTDLLKGEFLDQYYGDTDTSKGSYPSPPRSHTLYTKDYKKARILFIDIETAPLKGHLWSLWQQGIGLNQLVSDWYILSFTAKWADEDETIYRDIRDTWEQEDDFPILEDLWELLDQADFVVGHNVKKFDLKKINARFIMNGFPKPSTYRIIDTLLISKALFGFTSNKLEYLTDKLCKKYKKLSHSKFPGHKLWDECLKGNIEAWDEMEKYNIHDVLSNQEVYEVLMPWDSRLPNFDLYVDGPVDMSVWEENGFHYTNLGKYQKYRNKETGQQRRGRTNLLCKDKRKSLLANIIN